MLDDAIYTMERINWSSIVRSIHGTRSGRALFFKPVCVIAAVDLADEGRIAPDDVDAEGVVGRFYDYVAPFFDDRAADGFQPLWHLSNNQLWTFFDGDRALTSKDFSNGRPNTKKRLFDGFDRLAIHEGVKRIWQSPEHRRTLRDQMLLMLQEGDESSRQLVRPLFDPHHIANRDQWPSQEKLAAYFAPLRQPTLFDDVESSPQPPIDEELKEPTALRSIGMVAEPNLSPTPDAIENVPSPVDYVWEKNQIVVGPNLASLPIFPFATSRRDHASRLEACTVHAQDLASDLDGIRWQIREDYKLQIKRYLDRLPREVGSGNILLADAAIRILRDIFAAEQLILPAPFAAALKAMLQHHAALRPFYPEVESFYRAVKTGRIGETLPLDAVESIIAVVREQTPTVFGESVSAAIAEASAPDPKTSAVEAGALRREEFITPPPDPLGELDGGKAHDFQLAGVFNRLWKVFNSSDKFYSSTSAWMKTYNELSGPVTSVVTWLRNFIP